MSLFSRLKSEPVPTVNVAELQEMLVTGKSLFLLDVRQPEEFHLSHIQGAALIPLGQLDRRMKEIPEGREIVCICASGHRSVPAVKKLMAAGYTASSMKNGMIAWQLARLPITRGI
jgi:rhodanese-related sulfurtransferase